MKRNKNMKNLSHGMLMCGILMSVVSCSHEETTVLDNQLTVNVALSDLATRSVVEGSQLPDGSSIGLTLVTPTGAAYDQQSYQNVMFTCSGQGNQVWSGDKRVLLSATEGKAFGYYPYDASVTDLSQIHITTDTQYDYMYAIPAGGVCAAQPTVNLTLHHAQAAMRFSIRRGSYTGVGQMTRLSVQSDAIATRAVMDALNCQVNSLTATGVEVSPSFSAVTLTDVAVQKDILVIPTAETHDMIIRVVVDGDTYAVTLPDVMMRKEMMYHYTLVLDATGMTVSQVAVTEWGNEDQGEWHPSVN